MTAPRGIIIRAKIKELHPSYNDRFEYAGLFGAVPSLDTSTRWIAGGNTTEPGEPMPSAGAVFQTVWLEIELPSGLSSFGYSLDFSRSYAFDPLSSDNGLRGGPLNLIAAVYEGSSLGGLAELVSIADVAANGPLNFTVSAGNRYFLQVGTAGLGYNGEIIMDCSGTSGGGGGGGGGGGTTYKKIDVTIDGTTITGTLLGSPLKFGWLQIGSYFSGSSVNHHSIRNVKVGSTPGGNDLFDLDASATIVPPFDAIVGSGADISIAAGDVTVNNAGADVVATHDLGADQSMPVYIHFETFIFADEFATGFASGDFLDYGSHGGGLEDGFYYDSGAGGWFMLNGTLDLSTIAPLSATWQTFDVKLHN